MPGVDSISRRALSILVVLLAAAVSGQAYPAKPIRVIIVSKPTEFETFIRADRVKWAEVSKASGAKANL
jgi:tripartite-type tricarboxylate transporter receptor subunit TctC